MTTKNYAAETKGDLKITYADGRVEIINKDEADVRARAIVKRPRDEDNLVDIGAPICSGLMLTDPDDEDD